MQRHVVPGARQFERDRAADAPRRAGDERDRACGRGSRAWTCFLQCGDAAPRRARQCIDAALPALVELIREAIERAGGWMASTATWRSRCTRPASATTPTRAASSAAAGVGQRLRHRARDDAAVRPRARAAQVRAGARGERQRRGVRVRRRLGRARRAAARGARRRACARYSIVEVSGSLRARQRERLAAHGDARALARRLARGDARRRRSATRCSTRCRCSCCTATASAGSSAAWRSARRARFRWSDRPTALRPPLEARVRPPARRLEMHAAGRGLRRLARRAAGARRRLLHRLRLSGRRVLPPAAQRRHADVPPRAPRRHRSAGRRGPQGHHRARRFHRHRAGRRRTPGSTSSATPRRRAFSSTAG